MIGYQVLINYESKLQGRNIHYFRAVKVLYQAGRSTNFYSIVSLTYVIVINNYLFQFFT